MSRPQPPSSEPLGEAPAAPPRGQEVVPIDPFGLFRILWRYKWQVAAVPVLFVAGALIAAYLVTPIYRSSATLLIEPRVAKIVSVGELYENEERVLSTDEHLNTQVEVLRSRPLAEQVLEELELRGEAGSRNGSQRDPLEWLRESIEIEPLVNTNLIRIHGEAESPEYAARIANEVVEAYVRSNRAVRSDVTEEATGWLTQRLEEIREDLERSEAALQAFYDSQELVNVGGARGLVEQEVTDNAHRLREARRTRTEIENVYRRIVRAGKDVSLLEEVSAINDAPLVQATKQSFLEAREDVRELETRYGSRHPKLIAARARLEDTRSAYERQVHEAAEGIRSQYEIARSTEESLAEVVQASRDQIQDLDRKHHELTLLEREVETNRRLFETFLERIKEADIAGSLNIGQTRVVEPAVPDPEPYRPRAMLWALSAGFCGLLLGAFGALARAGFDDSLKTPVDLERVTARPALAALPVVADPGPNGERLARLQIDAPSARFSEAIRTLRTGILIHKDEHPPLKTLLVTSAVPSEGKTAVALNLAAAMGRTERVILVDADLRRPRVGSTLGLPRETLGLTDAIAGRAEVNDCIHDVEKGSIRVMPSGSPTHYALELLSSSRFDQLLKALAEKYDWVLVDSPPCMPVSDALMLSGKCDGTIFLVKSDATSEKLVSASLDKLEESGAHILGAVLNQAELTRFSGYAYGYYHYDEAYDNDEVAV